MSASAEQPEPVPLPRRLQDALGGTALAWACLWITATTLASGSAPLLSQLQAGGVLAVYCLGAMALLVLATMLGERLGVLPRAGAPAGARDIVRTGLVVMVAALVSYLPLREASATLLSADLAEVDRIRHLAGSWSALGVGASASLLLWLARRRGKPYPRALWGVFFFALLLATRSDYQAISNGREWLLLCLSAPVLVFCFLDLGHRTRRLVPLGLAMVASIATLFATLGPQAHARAELVRAHVGTAELLRWVLGAFDLDGDGYPGMLGGSDCDDTNPGVHPAALEFVGNGIDDNCLGGDLASFRQAGEARATSAQPSRSAILISIDALRSDMLDRPPGGPDPMPYLRAFARGGAHFPSAYVQATNTGHSLQSVMSGSWPMSFNSPQGEWLGAEPSLATRLSERGYHTLVQHQVWMADAFTGENLDPKGWAAYAGFQEIDDTLAHHNRDFRGKTADETTARFIDHLQRLQGAGTPFLAWTHYIDPHAEYLPRECTPFEAGTPWEHYLQEVYATDRALGPLFAYLERSGFLEHGLVVIFSDHGELVGDAGRYGHARWVDEEILRGVLVVRGAGVPPGVQPTRVRMIDVLPTVMDLALGVEPASDGRSLARIWRDGERADRDVFAQNTYGRLDLRIAISGRHKLVESARHGVRYLYDLSADAAETHNLVQAQPERVAAMRRLLGERWDRSMNASVLHARVEAEARAACARGDAAACAAAM